MGTNFFWRGGLEGSCMTHNADSRRGEVARGRSRARSNGNQSHLHAQLCPPRSDRMTTCNLRFRVWQRRGSGRWGKRPFDGDRYAGEPVTPASMAVALLGLLVALAIADCTEVAIAVGVRMRTPMTLPDVTVTIR